MLAEVLLAVQDRSFLFSLTDLTWKDGPVMPGDLTNLESVQVEDGLVVIGGLDNERVSMDTISKIDDNYAWTVYFNGLERPKYEPIGVGVPDDFLNCD